MNDALKKVTIMINALVIFIAILYIRISSL
jgi:hypothetical protein